MLFQGQEFAASAPFLYFADHRDGIRDSVRVGRREFMMQFQSIASANTAEALRDPGQRTTFESCKLDLAERQKHRGIYDFHRTLLALRRTDPAFSTQRADLIHGVVLNERALALRFFCDVGDRMILVNLGSDLDLAAQSAPLLAPPYQHRWRLLLSSEDVRYGGKGCRPVLGSDQWIMTAQSAQVFAGDAP
jgi:maltooligosyltrehalose trehalohydrolase